MIIRLFILFFVLQLASCSSSVSNNKQTANENKELGDRAINYYENRTVSSIEVPPDLTKPNIQEDFDLSPYLDNINQNSISFNEKTNDSDTLISKNQNDIKVIRSGQRRWLVVDRPKEEVWDAADGFLKSNGFIIKKSNKNIGVMETNFLKNVPDIPANSLGFIRKTFKNILKAKYALPTVDKYRIRIEPINDGKSSEVYLSLFSMAEVKDKESTIWQAIEKDEILETEMLYTLMLYLGSDKNSAKSKILASKDIKQDTIKILSHINGYNKLSLSLNKNDTWRSLNWAFNQLEVDVEDKDFKEGSFYVVFTKEKKKGFLGLFGEKEEKKVFLILLEQTGPKTTEVYFINFAQENTPEIIEFGNKFLSDIAKQF